MSPDASGLRPHGNGPNQEFMDGPSLLDVCKLFESKLLTVKSFLHNDKCIFGEGQFKYRDNSDGHRKTATRKS